MTDLIKALADGSALLARLTNMVEQVEDHTLALDRLQERINHVAISLERLEGKLVDMDTMDTDHADLIERLDERVDRIKDRVRILEENGNGGEDLEDRVGEILDRKLDHCLEDAVTEALSGREITICL